MLLLIIRETMLDKKFQNIQQMVNVVDKEIHSRKLVVEDVAYQNLAQQSHFQVRNLEISGC